jgi:tetratricopeptide (TPR) repeat protein
MRLSPCAPPSVYAHDMQIRRADPAFIDRDGQLEHLFRLTELASTGTPQLALVTGELGTGKSTLLAALSKRVAEAGHLDSFLSAECEITVSGQSVCMPLQPFKSILEDLLGLKGDDLADIPKAGIRGVKRGLHALVNLGPELIGTFLPPAGLILGAARYAADEKGLVDRIRRRSEPNSDHLDEFTKLAIDRLARVIVDVAREQLLVIAIDDLHWADEATLAEISFLGRRIVTGKLAGTRLLMLGTYRPIHTTGGPNPHQAHLDVANHLAVEMSRYATESVRINLDEVTERNKEKFCSQVAEDLVELPSEDLKKALCERTGGNPFFVVQVLHALQATEVHSVEPHTGPKAGGMLDNLPDTLDLALEQRLSSLADSEAEILETAAVCGATFVVPDVASMLGRTERDVARSVDNSLVHRAALLMSSEVPSGTRPKSFPYKFKHALVREHIYARTGPETRRQLHERFFRLLSNDPVRSRTAPLEVAFHAWEAGQIDIAINWTKRAADGAFGRQEMLQTLSIVEPVLRTQQPASDFSTEAVRELIELHLMASAAKIRLYAAETATAHAQEATRLAREISDRALEARAILQCGIVEWKSRRYGPAEQYLDAALVIATELGLLDVIAQIHANRGTVYNRTGRFADALAEYAAAESGPNPKVARQARNNKAVVLGALLGQYEEAIALYQRCREDAHAVGDRSSELFYLQNLNAYRRTGNYDMAVQRQEEAVALALELGEIAAEASSLTYLGSTELLRRGPRSAIDFFRRALARIDDARGQGVERYVAEQEALSRSAFCLLLMGELKEANRLAFKGRVIARHHNVSEERSLGTSRIVLGLTLLALKKKSGRAMPRIRPIFEDDLKYSRSWPAEYWAPKYNACLALVGLAAICPSEGYLQEAGEYLETAIRLCSPIGVLSEMALFLDAFDLASEVDVTSVLRSVLRA